MNGKTLGFAAMAVIVAFGAVAGEVKFEMIDRPVFAVPKMRTAPVIDGRVDESEWADALEMQKFVPLHRDLVFPADADVWLGRDDEKLYVAAVMAVNPNGLTPSAPPPIRRGNGGVLGAFNGDCFEFDFCSDQTLAKEAVSHMIVAFNGCYYSTASENALPISWDPPNFTTKSQLIDGKWHFEYSIPLSEARLDPKDAEKHAIRIARDWKNIHGYFGIQSSLCNNEGSFEKAGNCARMPFYDDAPVVQVKDVGMHGAGDTHFDTYPFKVRVANTTSKPMELNVLIHGQPVNSQPKHIEMPLTLQPGEEKVFKDTGAVLSDELVDFRVIVSGSDGRVFYARRCNLKPNFEPIEWIKSGQKVSGAKIRHAFFPSYNRIRAYADLTEAKGGKNAKVNFAVLSAKGEKLSETNVTSTAAGIADVIFDTSDLKAYTKKSGSPDYLLVMTAEGVEGGVKTNRFVRYVFDWEDNRIGRSDMVLQPFTPVKREPEVEKIGGGGQRNLEKVSVLQREHIVNKKTGLFHQIYSAGKPLLARPMRLVGTTSVRQQDGAAAASDFSTSKPLNFSTSTEWDYDGMMTWTLKFEKGQKIDSLKLEIPLRAERAPLMHTCPDGIRISYAGAVPAGEGSVWQSSMQPHVAIVGDYVPYIWIGGTLRGLSVFGENDRGWEIDWTKKIPHQEIVREKDGTVTLVLNLIQKPVEITGERRIRIGFLATPTKPMPQGWRRHDFGTFLGSGKCFGVNINDADIMPWDGTTEFWEKMAECRRTGRIDEAFLKRTHERYDYHHPVGSKDYNVDVERITRHFRSGIANCARTRYRRPMTWYTNARGVDFATEQGRTFCDEWNRQEWFANQNIGPFSKRDYDLDPVKSFQDYAAWVYHQSLAMRACDNYYWDDIYLNSNFNLVGTDAYRLPEGDVQPASGVFSMRALVRRCAMVQGELGLPWEGNWVHMTSTAIAPILSFAGVNYDLEDGGSVNDFQDRYGRDYMLASTIGRQHGNKVKVMGYFGTTTKEEKARLQRCGTGVMLVYELNWDLCPTWNKHNRALVDWGYRSENVKVWNDFDEDVAFPVAFSGIKACGLAMTHLDRRATIVVVSANDDRAGAVTVKPDFGALFTKPGAKAWDFETGAELPMKDGAVTVTLKRHDFAIIEFK